MLNFFRNFTEWLLGVINSIFKQNIEMEAFLNVFIMVIVVAVLILIIAYIRVNKKYKTLIKNIKRDNIQVVKHYRHGKQKDVIVTKTALRNPKKNKRVGKAKESYTTTQNVTDIVED